LLGGCWEVVGRLLGSCWNDVRSWNSCTCTASIQLPCSFQAASRHLPGITRWWFGGWVFVGKFRGGCGEDSSATSTAVTIDTTNKGISWASTRHLPGISQASTRHPAYNRRHARNGVRSWNSWEVVGRLLGGCGEVFGRLLVDLCGRRPSRWCAGARSSSVGCWEV
jgi:hypothetical protein